MNDGTRPPARPANSLLSSVASMPPQAGPIEPIVYVQAHGRGQWKFRCEYCRVDHYHGRPPGSPTDGLGHRAAHCWRDGSPYSRHGYILVLDKQAAA